MILYWIIPFHTLHTVIKTCDKQRGTYPNKSVWTARKKNCVDIYMSVMKSYRFVTTDEWFQIFTSDHLREMLQNVGNYFFVFYTKLRTNDQFRVVTKIWLKRLKVQWAIHCAKRIWYDGHFDKTVYLLIWCLDMALLIYYSDASIWHFCNLV